MQETRTHFTQDYLINRMRNRTMESLTANKISQKANAIANIDCIMGAFAMFTFKFPSLLQFDKKRRSDKPFFKNLKTLFKIDTVPCDTYMRERLD